MTDWDAIIVGAGPAGSALALRLLPGRRILLLERQADGDARSPRIGESLPGAARVLLERMGGIERFLTESHVERSATVSTWESETATWFDHLRDPHGAGWHLDRAQFDAGLRQAAVDAGAELLVGGGRLRISQADDRWCVELDGRVTATKGARSHHAPVLVDASGRTAAVARHLGLAPWIEDRLICLYAHLSADDDDRATRLCVDPNGWWYSVRVPNNLRVLAFHLDADDSDVKSLRDSASFLAKARQHPLLAEVLPLALDTTIQARAAGSSRLDFDALSVAPRGFFAIGDAMLAFDPIASQGLFNALASAESVAQAIDQGGSHAARERYLEEMRAVHARYRDHLRSTYAAALRPAPTPFWTRRSGVASPTFAPEKNVRSETVFL